MTDDREMNLIGKEKHKCDILKQGLEKLIRIGFLI